MTRRARVAVLLGSFTLPAPAYSQAPGPPALEYGTHDVGFTVIEALDSTRAFRPLRDFTGDLAAETARPIQVSIWYPADAPTGARRMRAGEFRLLRETEVDFDVVLSEADQVRLRSEFIEAVVSFGQDRETAARTWDGETPAVRDAPRVPGAHPTMLHVGAVGVSDPLLPAYLASHGFVVASFPSNGRMTEGALEFTPNELTLDTGIDDIGFVHALLRRLPYADTRRLAVASFSGSSLAALLWTMRDMQPAAIIAVEGWERYRRGADLVMASVHYDPHRVRVPFLMLERAADEASPRYAKVPDVVGALPYAEITRVSFRDAAHGDFLSHVTFGHTPHHAAIYEASAGMIRRFLEANIAGEDNGRLDLAAAAQNASFAIERQPAIGPVPTEEELYRLAETDPAAAAAAYRDAAAIVPGSTLFREHVLARVARFATSAADSAIIMEIVRDAYSDTATAPPAPLEGAEPASFAVSVSELGAATRWYREVLGLDFVREAASADGTLRARVLASGPVIIELIHHRSTISGREVLEPGAHRFQLQGFVKAGVFVSAIDRLYAHLRERGVQMDQRIGTDRELGLRFFIFRDPDGNRIQVFER